MTTFEQTHYEALRIPRSATQADVKKAYHAVLSPNHPEKAKYLPPFARALVGRNIRLAEIAWEVLSNSARREDYDAGLPYLDPHEDP